MSNVGWILLSCLGVLIAFWGVFLLGGIIGYKQGQIDYANGEEHFSLQKNAQGEMVWQKKK